MSRPTRRLFDLEIDEVSAVDRPANQHGLITIAKALGDGDPEEGAMTTIFTEAGEEITSLDQLELGAVVRDADGNELQYLPVNDEGQVLDLDGQVLDVDPESVYEIGEAEDAEEPEPVLEDAVGKGLATELSHGLKSGLGGWKEPGLGRAGRTAAAVGRNPKKAAAATAGGLGVAGGGAYLVGETKKSLGTSVLEQLSKAVTDADRDAVIAKAMDEVEIAKAEAAQATEMLEIERDIRITDAYIAKAAEYNLPVEAGVLGPILKSVATVLTDEQLDVLDELLSSVGEALYAERGISGGATNSGVLDEVYGMSAELVGKSAGAVSLEQATTAMFETNPGAYETYLAEQNGR